MKKNIAVIFGGKSTEHEVSIISALQAMENLDKEKYNVIPLYMSKNSDFYYNDKLLFNSKSYKNLNELMKLCENVIFVKEGNKTYIRSSVNTLFGKKTSIIIDVAFPIVHGTNVEDGNLQGFLHTLNIPLVGPDCLAASLSMDKFVMKEYCKEIGIPVIDAIRLDKLDYKKIDQSIDMIEEEIGYPMIVKPVNLGSSIGIKKANDRENLKSALNLAFSFANIVLVEKAITNLRELNCAVLGNKFSCECSAIEEPFGTDEILSFADKYLSGSKNGGKGLKNNFTKFSGIKNNAYSKSGMASLKRKIPADIDKVMEDNIKLYAKKIFKYLGCTGVSRIDFILDKDTGKIYANEINPIPGSLSYYLFEPIGISYTELLDRLITIAIDNYRDETKLSFTFDNNLLSNV